MVLVSGPVDLEREEKSLHRAERSALPGVLSPVAPFVTGARRGKAPGQNRTPEP